jgi:hypothetical protein
MKKKLQLFISSTYTDMLSERQAAVEATLQAGHIPAGMELFAAADDSQWETIRKWIDNSDVFMLILGGRYGSVEPKSGKSYVELEYDYASSIGKPLFAAVIGDANLDVKVKSLGQSAIETRRGAEFAAFKEKVKGRICRFFGDANELKLIVFQSLSDFLEDGTLSGWVRGSDVIDAKATLEEISRLQAENKALRDRVGDLEQRAAADGRMPSGLSAEARELLICAKDADGFIERVEYGVGTRISIGVRIFSAPDGSLREEVRWRAATDELLESRLVERRPNGDTISLTRLGFEIADQLSASAGGHQE